MKLQTQFTVLKKDKGDLDHMKKLQTSEKTLKQNCKHYLSEENYLVHSN